VKHQKVSSANQPGIAVAVQSQLKRKVTSIMKNACSFVRQLLAMGIAMLLALSAVPTPAQAVLTSSVGTSTLTYAQPETITVSGIPASLSFTPCTGGVCTGTLNVTTTWQLASTRTRVAMNLFFANPAQAMSDSAGDFITAANINANTNGGVYGNCNRASDSILTGVIPVAAACNAGLSANITAGTLSSSATAAFTLQIPSSVLQTLPANTFTGTLSYVAGAQ
jgi:hypothetical protein